MTEEEFFVTEQELKNNLEKYIKGCAENDLEPADQLHDIIMEVSNDEVDML